MHSTRQAPAEPSAPHVFLIYVKYYGCRPFFSALGSAFLQLRASATYICSVVAFDYRLAGSSKYFLRCCPLLLGFTSTVMTYADTLGAVMVP